MADHQRRDDVRGRALRSRTRNSHQSSRTPHAADPIRSYDGAASLPARTRFEARQGRGEVVLSVEAKRQAKKAYHGPRLSRFLPAFFIVLILLEGALVVLGAK